MTRFLTQSIAYLFILSFLSCTHLFAKSNDNGTDVQMSAGESTTLADGSLFLYSASLSAAVMGSKEEGNKGILSNARIKIVNLGPVVNSKGVDYAPTISADGKTLFFVSDRVGSKLFGNTSTPSHDFWAAKKNDRLDTVFNTPYNIDLSEEYGMLGVNTISQEGAASLAADRQSLYFTGCGRPDGMGKCDIYKTTIEGDKWGKPINLGKNVNSANWDSQPSIAPDQSRIYFVSTRKGPNSNGDEKQENMDIWYSDWNEDEDDWMPAKNLVGVNTEECEVSPFIAADNVTLFFASNGHEPRIGKQDFFVTRLDPSTNKWSKPENLGEPINTPEDEQFITLPASGDIIYFASKRTDLKGAQGNFDIFMAFVPTFFRAVNMIGTVTDECSDEFIPASITIKNPITGKIVKDSLTMQKTEFELVVSNTEYGNPKDSIEYVDFEITASNPKYGKKTVVQRVTKPNITDNPEEAKKFADEVKVKITLGQRPVISTLIDEADYIKRTKKNKPELADFNGLVMEQVQTWDLYPLLNYVFFEPGSSVIPPRYNVFKNNAEIGAFADTTIEGGTLKKYYHILNIFGFRLNRYPNIKVEIVGCNDGTTPEEKRPNLSKERAENVFNYLKDVWKIAPDRMKLTFRDKPAVVSNLKDSLGIVENRRVEILCDDWNVTKPVFDREPKTFPQPIVMDFVVKNGIEDAIVAERRIEITRGNKPWNVLKLASNTEPKENWDWTNTEGKYPKDEVPYTAQFVVKTQSGAECKSDPITIPVKQITTENKKTEMEGDSTLENYSLILFPFNSADAGAVNERIMREYVYDRVKPTTRVVVIGHTDVVGLYDHNKKLSERRAGSVRTGINKETKGSYSSLAETGVGEDEPIYPNELPEGRFYNRTVMVIIRTPVAEYENK